MKQLVFMLLALFLVASVIADPDFDPQSQGSAPRIHVRDGTSTNWAGYAVETSLSSPQKNSVTDVYGSWVVPAVTCSAGQTAYSSFWVGIDGYSSGTVEQTGTDSDCYSGTPTYYAWYEMYPKFPVNLNMQISPGDTMTGEVRYVSGGKKGGSGFVITIRDVTKGTSFTTTQNSPRAFRSSAEWIAEAPSSGSVLPLANFGTAQFTSSSATLNGHTGSISDAAWQNDRIDMVTSGGSTTKAQTSALSSGGTAFSVNWLHS